MDRLLTPQSLAELLSVPKRTVYALAAAGALPGAIRIGRRLRFDSDAVREWLRTKVGAKRRDAHEADEDNARSTR